jgi:tetratricopeptide (TPR) repeat protein
MASRALRIRQGAAIPAAEYFRVPKNDWYRKTTWTSDDAKDFFAQLARSQTDIHRAQYLKIQALTLKDTKQYDAALELVELAIEKFPNREMTQLRKLRAECLLALNRREQSLEAFRSAFQAQREQRNLLCNVGLAFAEAFYDVDDGAHRSELLELLREEVAQPESFGPFLGFRYALMFTRLLAGLGQMKAAAKWADRALSAQRAEISGLRHYKPVGWASGIDEGTEIWLRELAARGKE